MKPRPVITEAVRAHAARELPELARRYLKIGRRLALETGLVKADWAALHKFRIRSKRMRYTLELFEPVYGGGLSRLLSSLKRVQDVLGEINDCQTVLHMKAIRSEKRVQSWLKERRTRLLAEFHRIWQQDFNDEAASNWVALLRDQAAARPVVVDAESAAKTAEGIGSGAHVAEAGTNGNKK